MVAGVPIGSEMAGGMMMPRNNRRVDTDKSMIKVKQNGKDTTSLVW